VFLTIQKERSHSFISPNPIIIPLFSHIRGLHEEMSFFCHFS